MKFLFLLILGAGVTACSFRFQKTVVASTQTVDSNSPQANPKLDSLIAPYRRAMIAEFSQVIGSSKNELLTNRNSMTLGFWICDELIQYAQKPTVVKQGDPVFAMINYGGLRSDIPAGPITVGTIYKVMPFDNRISFLKLAVDKLKEIESYLKKSGGEPIGGFRIEKGQLVVPDSTCYQKGYFWMITSDFLANGGDKMTFFDNPLERIDTHELLRDFILNRVKQGGEIGNEDNGRIEW